MLGNGFDIQCKYYTKYINFKHFIEIWEYIKNTARIINNFRECSDSGSGYYIDTEYDSDIDFFIKNVNNVIFYSQDIENIDKVYNRENTFCRFLFLTVNGDCLWSDIEKALEDLLMSLYSFFSLIKKCIANKIDFISEEYININCNYKKTFNYLYYDSLRRNDYNSFKLEIGGKRIVIRENKGLEKDEEDMINNLYNNLKIFNKAFSTYLYTYVCGLNNPNFDYKDCEQDNRGISDLINVVKKYNCEIISFNYTHSHKEILSLRHKNNNREPRFIHNTCEYIRNANHYQCPEIVIGIADGIFRDNTLYNRFEKTKLISCRNSNFNAFELVSDAQLYIIYGHSFAKSDKYFFELMFNEVSLNNKKMEIYYFSSNDFYNKIDSIKEFVSIEDLNKLILDRTIKFVKQNN